MPYTQDNMLLKVSSPLEADALLLEQMTGTEALSTPFAITLEMLSQNGAVDVSQLLAKPMTVAVTLPDGGPERYYSGWVRRFVQLGRAYEGLVRYRAELVPWFWFLSLASNCRIFQNKTVPDIVKAVFDAHGFSDYRLALRGSYNPREYCVQYRETDLQFVSRLLEEEGIFYYFEHTASKHTMVLGDSPSAIKAGLFTPLSAASSESGTFGGPHITTLEIEDRFATGKVTLIDYNMETPSTSLNPTSSSADSTHTSQKFERYDYPGGFMRKVDGDTLAKIRMDEAETFTKVVSGRTYLAPLASGEKLEVQDYYRQDANTTYQLVSVTLRGMNPPFRSAPGEDSAYGFESTFVAIPATVRYRPPQRTPKAIVTGAQTAVVVGPSGEEIYSDRYGRVKVQFFWDREGKKDESSSCWIRVASTWAGKNWGFIQLPRIGQEVIVDFLEGDPDRPIITGRVYNAEYMPPYALPGSQTQSGFKSRSTKAGGTEDFNEFRFEDKKGEESIYLHAQKDFTVEVENDEIHKVDHDRTTTVKNNEKKEVTEGFDETTVKKGYHKLTISEGDQTIEVTQGKQTITVNADRTVEIKQGNDSLKVSMGNLTTEVSQGNHETKVKMGNQTTTVDMGNVSMKASLGSISYEGMQAIELKVGGSSLKVDQMGVTIKGMMVKIEGEVQTEVKGMMATLQGSAMTTVKGGITMIN